MPGEAETSPLKYKTTFSVVTAKRIARAQLTIYHLSPEGRLRWTDTARRPQFLPGSAPLPSSGTPSIIQRCRRSRHTATSRRCHRTAGSNLSGQQYGRYGSHAGGAADPTQPAAAAVWLPTQDTASAEPRSGETNTAPENPRPQSCRGFANRSRPRHDRDVAAGGGGRFFVYGGSPNTGPQPLFTRAFRGGR